MNMKSMGFRYSNYNGRRRKLLLEWSDDVAARAVFL
jgi:hypothetical protein